MENFSKIKDLKKTIETLETEKSNVQNIEKSEKNPNKTFTTKDLNEKVKQKTAIIEFNLKKEYEQKLKENTEASLSEIEKSKQTLERTTDNKIKKQMQVTEKKLNLDFESK